METRLNTTTASNTVGSLLRERYAHSDNFIEKLINDSKCRRTDGPKVTNVANLKSKDIKKRGDLSQRRQDRKLSNVRTTKKTNSSPKSKFNQRNAKGEVKQKDSNTKKNNISEQKGVISEKLTIQTSEEKCNEDLTNEVDENNIITEIKENTPKVNSDLKDFMSSLSADKKSVINSVVTDSVNETRIKVVNDK